MDFRIKILGNNAAVPAHGRNQTSQLVIIHNQYLLLDCGENTQQTLLKSKVNINKIHHIFISHLHGDHYYGLMGLISTMQLFGRKRELSIYAPTILKEIIDLNLKASDTRLNFPITFLSLDQINQGIILDHKHFIVKHFPLTHRIVCNGFLIKEKSKPYRIVKEKLHRGIKLSHIAQFLKGNDARDDEGHLLYSKEDYTLPPKRSLSYAYCSDTVFDVNIIPTIKGVDVLYHESTFLDDLKDRAKDTFHSTASQAATIAKKANVGKLYLGHYSTRYKEIEPFLDEARQIFQNSFLSLEGEEITIAEPK